MALTQSPHLTDIPQAIRIAASGDTSIDPALKQQAFEYLTKVKELAEETWQDCLSLYLQGAGAAGPSNPGKDGKEKLDTDLRLFCEQVVEDMLINKSEIITHQAEEAMYKALVEFARTEYLEGPCESGQSFMRNKFAFTLAHVFIATYPEPIATFLHPFLSYLSIDPSPSKQPNLHPPLLTIRLLTEIALEIHDSTMKSARPFSAVRQNRDGEIRDAIRKTGDEGLAVEGMLGLAEKGLEVIERGGDGQLQKWVEVVDLTIKAFAAWAPWIDITVALTPKSLALLHRLLRQSLIPLRIPAASVFRTFVAKGIKDPNDKLQCLKVLDVASFLDPLEASTREIKGDSDMDSFRASLGSILQAYGSELLRITESPESPDNIRIEADTMLTNSLPLLLRFLTDRRNEVATSVFNFVGDYLRISKKYNRQPQPEVPNGKAKAMPPPPAPFIPLPPAKRQFISSLLDVIVRQMEWADDVDWEISGDAGDSEDEVSAFCTLRINLRGFVDQIAQIDKDLYIEVVAAFVVSTLETLGSRGVSAVTWQQAELAVHLVYIFGEILRNNTRAAFYELPPEVANRSSERSKLGRASCSKLPSESGMSSGASTPTGVIGDTQLDLNFREKIDYTQYPLTPLGQLLNLCMTVGVASFPHPSVPLQYFEIGVRYGDFWRSRSGSVQPMLEAMLDTRGIHHPDEEVRRRCFYLAGKFIKDNRNEMDKTIISPIVESMMDMMVISAKLPEATPEDDVLLQATTGKSYFQDQLYLFESAGILVSLLQTEPDRQIAFLEAIAGPLMSGIGSGLSAYRQSPQNLQAVIQVHHHLLALGHFAKGFPPVSDDQIEALPYQSPFKQMTEALLEALDVMKTQRVVRESARFAFSQFVGAIGSSVAELVPRFVTAVVTEFESSELVDFITFLGLLMHRLKANTFETIDMLLLPLLSRIFSVLQNPVTGTDEGVIHRRLQEAYLTFFTSLMNANLEGVFISPRNKSEFENVLSSLLSLALNPADGMSQRLSFGFFAKSVIAWGTSPEAAAGPSVFAESAMSELSKRVEKGLSSPTGQYSVNKEERAAQALPGYENFIYQRLVPACFQVPADPKFNVTRGHYILFEIAMLLRNTLRARGQEAVDFLLNDLFPKLNCPPEIAAQFVQQLRTQQSKDFRKTFVDFIKAMKS